MLVDDSSFWALEAGFSLKERAAEFEAKMDRKMNKSQLIVDAAATT